MFKRARLDRNHGEIVDALRKVGASVQSLASLGDGVPDILAGFRGKNYLLEVKDPLKSPSARTLTPDQIEWHQGWNGQAVVVETTTEALTAIGAIDFDGLPF